MSDIGIKIGTNIKRESVFINHKVSAADKVIRDKDGKVIEVIKDSNILSEGSNRREAANKIYGKF